MARFEFKLPDIGEGVVEGEIVQWLVEVGDTVAEDAPIVEIMTDKATVSIPTPKAGKVVERHGNVGDIFPVGGTLVVLETEGGVEAVPAPEAPKPEASSPAAAAPVAAAAASQVQNGKRVLATPVTRRMARELGVDLSMVPGSGPQGRVLKS